MRSGTEGGGFTAFILIPFYSLCFIIATWGKSEEMRFGKNRHTLEEFPEV